MSVTCYLSGRLGNIVFAVANMIAYAKKYDLQYWVPTEAIAYRHFRNGDVRVPIIIPSTAKHPPKNPTIYNEPNSSHGTPRYHEIPKIENVKLLGYFQSFLYFDWCRDHILQTFNLPHRMERGMTAISVRRGDCLESPEAFPIAPKIYYQNAVKFMQERGFNNFRLYSDDIPYCKQEFNQENFPEANFQFSEGKTEMMDYVSLANCENQITARSTFSLTAAWFNLNPNKIVCVPTTKHRWWNTQNADLIPPYFHQIDFINPE